jgi:DNA-directed DNA polymerase III PolC
MFTHLHVHSNYSLLDGAIPLAELVSACRDLGMEAVALTDHDALYGVVEFCALCNQAGIRPIVGMEATLEGDKSLVLLAQGKEGYANLCRLSSEAKAGAAGYLTLDRLRGRTEGLIALSGGKRGHLNQLILAGRQGEAQVLARELVLLFGPGNVFLEMQIQEEKDESDAALLALGASRLGLPTVATNNVHYLWPGDATRHRVLSAMRATTTLEEPHPDKRLYPSLYLRSPKEMEALFFHYPMAVENAGRIAERCRLDLLTGTRVFPSVKIPPGETSRSTLSRKCWEGAQRRYATITPEVEERLRHEVETVDELGYTPYFLVVADIVGYAIEKGIPWSPRGSASDSLACYCLGITQVDPVAHDLYFERFLNRERSDPPDIDLDLCSRRRDEVITYVYQKYGVDRVAMVSTVVTLQARSAFREVAKAFGLAPEKIDALSERLPHLWHPGMRDEIDKAYQKILAQDRDPLLAQVIEMSRVFEGFPRHLSIHPGGMVIAPGPITDWVPVQLASKGLIITQYDLEGIARLGLIKIDLLGIKALTVLADAVELVRRGRGITLDLEKTPPEDERTAQLLSRGETIGCFQMESPGMGSMLRELGAKNLSDIIAAISLYRPGPLQGSLKDAFVRRHAGREEVTYLHPKLRPILHETYGVVLYQEQVLRIAHDFADLSLAQADVLRRAMSKFKASAEMATLKEAFIRGGVEHSGADLPTAEAIWRLLESFAGFGFCKAHAASYAVVAYRSAYLKANYPAEFMCAVLANWGGYYPQATYLREARRLGLAVRPPHVNHSGREFTLEREATGKVTLWMGLDQVRGLTEKTIQRIIAAREERPFSSLLDLQARAEPRPLEMADLVRVGAADGLGPSRPTMLRSLGLWEPEDGKKRGAPTKQQLMMALEAFDQAQPPLPEYSRPEKMAIEKELLGLGVSVHPLEFYTAELEKRHVVPSSRLAEHVGESLLVAGIRAMAHRQTTGNGQVMLHLTLEDLEGIIEVTLAPETYRAYQGLLRGSGPYLVRGRVRRDDSGAIGLVAEKIESLRRRSTRRG